ncbi:MAG: type II toxin-antitoxin system RelE/ParE family toxin [Acidobacteria bacterium]|nr:type II toxin-antitoxin system RelE/ParE family toxin [Acidobacteriota bacterium]
MTTERYHVVITRGAGRDLDRLDRAVLPRVAREIDALSAEPRPTGCRKLVNQVSLWRVRVGDWRVLYEIDDAARTVRVVAVRHRSKAYE